MQSTLQIPGLSLGNAGLGPVTGNSILSNSGTPSINPQPTGAVNAWPARFTSSSGTDASPFAYINAQNLSAQALNAAQTEPAGQAAENSTRVASDHGRESGEISSVSDDNLSSTPSVVAGSKRKATSHPDGQPASKISNSGLSQQPLSLRTTSRRWRNSERRGMAFVSTLLENGYDSKKLLNEAMHVYHAVCGLPKRHHAQNAPAGPQTTAGLSSGATPTVQPMTVSRAPSTSFDIPGFQSKVNAAPGTNMPDKIVSVSAPTMAKSVPQELTKSASNQSSSPGTIANKSPGSKPQVQDRAAYLAKLSALKTSKQHAGSEKATAGSKVSTEAAKTQQKPIIRKDMNEILRKKIAVLKAQKAEAEATAKSPNELPGLSSNSTSPLTHIMLTPAAATATPNILSPSNARLGRKTNTAEELNDAGFPPGRSITNVGVPWDSKDARPEQEAIIVGDSSDDEVSNEDDVDYHADASNVVGPGKADHKFSAAHTSDSQRDQPAKTLTDMMKEMETLKAAIAAKEQRKQVSGTPKASNSPSWNLASAAPESEQAIDVVRQTLNEDTVGGSPMPERHQANATESKPNGRTFKVPSVSSDGGESSDGEEGIGDGSGASSNRGLLAKSLPSGKMTPTAQSPPINSTQDPAPKYEEASQELIFSEPSDVSSESDLQQGSQQSDSELSFSEDVIPGLANPEQADTQQQDIQHVDMRNADLHPADTYQAEIPQLNSHLSGSEAASSQHVVESGQADQRMESLDSKAGETSALTNDEDSMSEDESGGGSGGDDGNPDSDAMDMNSDASSDYVPQVDMPVDGSEVASEAFEDAQAEVEDEYEPPQPADMNSRGPSLSPDESGSPPAEWKRPVSTFEPSKVIIHTESGSATPEISKPKVGQKQDAESEEETDGTQQVAERAFTPYVPYSKVKFGKDEVYGQPS